MSNHKQRGIEFLIVDLFVAISKTKECVRPFNNEEAFRQSRSHWDASIRQLKNIEGALNRLLEDEQFNANSSSYLRNIIDFRDIIVHSDFGNDIFEILDLSTNRLDLLDNDLKNVVHSSNINMSTAIEAEIMEYFKLDDKNTVWFLKKLNREIY